ncbi:MAG TPA: twin-arginine translocase TatA/TatE family subunit [Actinomycetota bacterium]|jgi:sec-independent protein translocase protein TatA|nr:twin-arginine translocase TatA/TatE family subunit [Actinomycetota bacterium]
MPNLGFAEMIVLLVIALVVFGPKKLPEMGRTVGRSLREFRRASAEIRNELRFEDEPPRVPSPGSRSAGRTEAPPEAAETTEPPPGDAPTT